VLKLVVQLYVHSMTVHRRMCICNMLFIYKADHVEASLRKTLNYLTSSFNMISFSMCWEGNRRETMGTRSIVANDTLSWPPGSLLYFYRTEHLLRCTTWPFDSDVV
jgi:hypothetical protein